jgi:hypothetical protein
MKVTMIFDTSDLSEDEELNRCLKALDYGLIIESMSRYLWKNLEQDTPDDAEKIHEKFKQLLNKFDVTPGEFIS